MNVTRCEHALTDSFDRRKLEINRAGLVFGTSQTRPVDVFQGTLVWQRNRLAFICKDGRGRQRCGCRWRGLLLRNVLRQERQANGNGETEACKHSSKGLT